MKVNRIRGTNDYYGADIKKIRYIEKICHQIMNQFGFNEIMTPIFEETSVFVRSVGDTSDIVNKEMYTFIDKGNRSVTLRPEATAPIVRALVENKLYAMSGLKKFYYLGPNFRYERPKAGRFRQFHQFGVEAFGDESPLLDADIINMAMTLFNKLGIKKIKVVVNNIGSPASRKTYTDALQKHFKDSVNELCPDCQVRYHKNPLRMFDCKIDQRHPKMADAPHLSAFLQPAEEHFFQQLLDVLTSLKINFETNDYLVRGLDYYESDVFEFICDDETSAIYGMAIGGGGRYNNLTKEFDGPDLKAIGFALGIERLMLLLDEQGICVPIGEQKQIVVMTIGETCKLAGLILTNYLRQHGLKVEIDYTAHNLKPQFKLSERVNADYLIIIGENEIKEQAVVVKDVNNNREEKIINSKINEYFKIGEKYEN